MLYITAYKKATSIVSKLGDWTQNGLWAIQKIISTISEKIKNLCFSEYTKDLSTYISAAKYPSVTVLYSKQCGGYPLPPHI